MPIIEGEYGITQIVGPPSRPDKSQAERDAERRADRISLSALLKAFKWTPDDLSAARGFGFPDAVGRKFTGWGVKGDGEPQFSRRAINVWLDSTTTFFAALPKKV
jgi:hypothetical protein